MLTKRWGVKLKRKTNKNIRQKNKTNKKTKGMRIKLKIKKQIKWYIYILARVREREKSPLESNRPQSFNLFLKINYGNVVITSCIWKVKILICPQSIM
jgi:hypothetical protein